MFGENCNYLSIADNNIYGVMKMYMMKRLPVIVFAIMMCLALGSCFSRVRVRSSSRKSGRIKTDHYNPYSRAWYRRKWHEGQI